MPEQHPRGLLDTSVVIDLETLPEDALPTQSAIAAITLAELGAGPHTTKDPLERAARLARLQAVESTFDPLPFGAAAARSYSYLVALVVAAGQNPRPRRLDLMIAATAHSEQLPVYTRHPADFAALSAALTVVPL